jgi:hypothetical protein
VREVARAVGLGIVSDPRPLAYLDISVTARSQSRAGSRSPSLATRWIMSLASAIAAGSLRSRTPSSLSARSKAFVRILRREPVTPFEKSGADGQLEAIGAQHVGLNHRTLVEPLIQLPDCIFMSDA